MVDSDQLSLVGDRGGVVDVGVCVHEAYDNSDVCGRSSDSAHRVDIVPDEGRLEEKVFGRVARDRHLREGHQIRAQAAGLVYSVKDLVDVTIQVSHSGVDLA